MRWRKRKPTDDPTSIGNLLCSAGLIDTAHIADALDFQRAHDVRLGEALVRLGKLSREQLEAAIAHQKAVRSNKPSDARKLVEIATQRTRSAAEAIASVTDKMASLPRAKNA